MLICLALFQETPALTSLFWEREFLLQTCQACVSLGLVECERLVPAWPLPLLGSFSLEDKHPFLGTVTWILFFCAPQEHSLHALCLLLVFPVQPLLLAREEKQSQGTEET